MGGETVEFSDSHDRLSRSSAERFIFAPFLIADSFLRVFTDAFLPVCASLSLRLCSAEKGGRFNPLQPLCSAAFWLVVIIFTLPTAYGPRSPWRAMWYSLARLPRSLKRPEASQIDIHSSNVSSNTHAATFRGGFVCGVFGSWGHRGQSIMTLLRVVKDVCLMVGVAIPQSVFANITGNRTMLEMVSLANEMAQRIAYDTSDWQKLKKTHTYIGTGTTTAFDLPENFKRMLLTSSVWRSTIARQPDEFHSRHGRLAASPRSELA